ncbi:conserved hypothetical protein [Trichinella spiralis]|uniref:hypothetical protein n=1 Tax=Trichinella spiralis TaxID=6334 RepID=UPI0001EFDED8|nr:conserved hypothetical protein [Trichinella spiralis]
MLTNGMRHCASRWANEICLQWQRIERLMRANRTHHSDSQWDIGRFNLRMIKYIYVYKFIIRVSLHKLIDNLTMKTIRLVVVVEMLFQERYLLGCLITAVY